VQEAFLSQALQHMQSYMGSATTSLETRLGRSDWGMVIILGHSRTRGRPRLTAELEPLVLRMVAE